MEKGFKVDFCDIDNNEKFHDEGIYVELMKEKCESWE